MNKVVYKNEILKFPMFTLSWLCGMFVGYGVRYLNRLRYTTSSLVAGHSSLVHSRVHTNNSCNGTKEVRRLC